MTIRFFGMRSMVHAIIVLAILIVSVFTFFQWNGAYGAPTLTTDKDLYNPHETVTVTGGGFVSDTAYDVPVIRPDGSIVKGDGSFAPGWDSVVSDGSGAFTYLYELNGVDGTYEIRVYLAGWSGDLAETPLASTTFFDPNPAADLDQCANDPAPSPSSDGCEDSNEWVNGNIGASKAVYFEGDSLPYRLTFDNLSAGAHNVIVEWDTTKAGKHALDYLTSFDRTVTTADPCAGVSGCSGPPNLFAIPKDPQVDDGAGSPVSQIAGSFAMYGATITSVGAPASVGNTSCAGLTSGAYCYSTGFGFTGDKSAAIQINFTTSIPNPVLAWAGHISTRVDWGFDSSAISVPGSPYHTRLIDLDGAGGNQDRSLSAEAVIFPGSITIIKDATPEGSTSFPFTASPSPLSNFSLVDDGTSSDTQAFNDITDFTTYQVTENTPSGWNLTGVGCLVTSENGGGSSISGSTATIDLAEGENYTCTFTNVQQSAHLIVCKHVINDNGGTATASDFTLDSGGTNDSPDDFSGVEPGGDCASNGTDVTLDAGSYSVSESGPSGYTDSYSADCSGTIAGGETKTCVVTNNDDAPSLKLIKHVINDNGGTETASSWTLSAGANDVTGSETAVEATDQAGTYDLSETTVAGYSLTSLTCDDDPGVGVTSVTIGLGETITCTFVNNDIAPTLTLVKCVVNGSNPGGTASPSDWTLTAGPLISEAADGSDTSACAAGSEGNTATADATAKVGYALSESGPDGYSAGSWSCTGTSGLSGSTVTLDLDEDAVCQITNTAKGMVELLKLTNGVQNETMNWTFTLQGQDVDESDSSPPTTVDFGGAKLIPGATYTLCETGIPAGWTLQWEVYIDGAWVIIPFASATSTSPVGADGYSNVYDPNYVDPPAVYTNDTRCVDFLVGVGETLNFRIDNQFPGGEPRTIGYWKNWNTCTGGNQPATAASNGGPAAGWYILDDILNSPGITIGVLTLDAGDCIEAVRLLDKSDIDTDQKKANDAAYDLAAQLMAAMLNLSAGAETCPDVQSAVTDAQDFLASIGFDGTGDYLQPKGKDKSLYQYAISLSKTLDNYNNGLLCDGGAVPPPPESPDGYLHIGNLTPSSVSGSHGRWTAVVEVLVLDENGVPVEGVVVSGVWSDGANGSASCTTAADGTCQVSKSNLKANSSSVKFTVTDMSKDGYLYDADGLLGGTANVESEQVVNKP
jgi:hypothetical protein